MCIRDSNSDTNGRDEVLDKCKATLPAPVFERINWFHLRGGLDYERMRFKHRMMMRMVYGMMRQRAKKGDEKAQKFCDGYGKSVDFTDRALLEPVLEFARSVNDKKGHANV